MIAVHFKFSYSGEMMHYRGAAKSFCRASLHPPGVAILGPALCQVNVRDTCANGGMWFVQENFGFQSARKLAQFDGGKRVPATISAVADAVRWAEEMRK
jgi:hypothetical protein